jgi:uncharacterized protein (TIGR02246 family)
MRSRWIKAFACLAAAIGYAHQLIAGMPNPPFERVIWPEDPSQIEAYSDIRALLSKSFEKWNAHDIDGFMEVAAWKSDGFVTILNGRTIRGWHQISAAYHQGYRDPNSMGSVDCDSLGTELLTPDLALVLLGWTQTVDGKKEIGTSYMVAVKFPFGWRVISNGSQFRLHMPLQIDPRQLRPEKISPFAVRERLIVPEPDPKDLFVNRDRYYGGLIQLSPLLERQDLLPFHASRPGPQNLR